MTRDSDELQVWNTFVGDLLTDHHLVCCNLSFAKPSHEPREIQARDLDAIDMFLIKDDIAKSDLLNQYKDLDLCTLIDTYSCTLKDILDKHAPLTTRAIKAPRRDPWITESVLNAQRKARALERRWRKHRTEENHETYKAARKYWSKVSDSSKREYNSNVVSDSRGDAGQLFRSLNKVMHRQSSNPMPDSNGPVELANNFCDFFKDKIDTIRSNFTSDVAQALAYDRDIVTSPLLQFREITEDELRKVIQESNNKYCELDPLPTALLKSCLDELIPVLTQIVNLSIRNSEMPFQYKEAIVKPLLKKPSMDRELKNYRPVSNLTFVSKIIEKVIGAQMLKHLHENKIGERLQSAYKCKHSTETALTKVFDELLLNLDNKNCVFLCLLDLSAAFDTVDHGLLIKQFFLLRSEC
jgi:hypothetical protein